LPLALIGFHPVAIAAVVGLGLLYQFFLHTAFPVSLGPLEWVLNTPAHHRVHHACNDPCLDKNYGNVLIVFDRLFGTFVAERSDIVPRYGLTTPLHSYNPFVIALHEWARLARDLWAARSAADVARALFAPPAARTPAPAATHPGASR
jgi:sterol desaturase/sphingolipid hydroxylase (fatty acid hydroxylase superfamily)